MGLLYQGYCWADIGALSSHVLASGPVDQSDGLAVPSGVVDGGGYVTVSYSYYPNSGLAASSFSVVAVTPSCADVGPEVNVTGLNVTDAVFLSWAVVACWVAAWGIKQIARAK